MSTTKQTHRIHDAGGLGVDFSPDKGSINDPKSGSSAIVAKESQEREMSSENRSTPVHTHCYRRRYFSEAAAARPSEMMRRESVGVREK